MSFCFIKTSLKAIQILGDNYNAIYNDLKLDIYWDNVVAYVEPYNTAATIL